MVILISFLILTSNQSYTVKADSVVLIDSTLYLFGHIKIFHEDLMIEGNRAIVNKDNVIIPEKFIISEKETKIEGEQGVYDYKNKVLYFKKGLEVLQPGRVLEADNGEYFREDKKMFFSGNVKSIIKDKDVVITGQEGEYNLETNFGVIAGDVELFKKGDSIQIFGTRMSVWGDTLFIMQGNVSLIMKDTRCGSDTLTYLIEKEEAILKGSPFVKTDTDSLSGNIIRAFLENGKLKQLTVLNPWGKRCIP